MEFLDFSINRGTMILSTDDQKKFKALQIYSNKVQVVYVFC